MASITAPKEKYYKLLKPLYNGCKLEMACVLETNSFVVFCIER